MSLHPDESSISSEKADFSPKCQLTVSGGAHSASASTTPGLVGDIAPFLLTSRQAATALAICPRTLWSLKEKGEIPFLKVGGLVRFSPNDLLAWIKMRTKGNESR